MRYRLRDEARRDLAQIWLETADRWSVDQAETYVRAIEHRLAHICEFPRSYPEYASRSGTFHKAPSGSHLIFYIVADGFIDVVRILPARMDLDLRLY